MTPPFHAGPLLATALLLAACDPAGAPTATDPATSATEAPVDLAGGGFRPPFDPSNFVAEITNPYLPGQPGTLFRYRSETPEGVEINTVRYTHETKQILGVTVTVVRDQVFLNGELTEDTRDWEAQDEQGNVWYFGEDTKELEDGKVVSTEGSWEAGKHGAKPGIIMPAHPKTGVTYVQEDAPDVAEDRGKALGLNAKVDVPLGSFDHCLHTLEWSLLERGIREHKFYCPGVGFVKELSPRGGPVTSELVSITHF